MKTELKEKWISALRSGKYEQGKGYLKQLHKTSSRRYETFCCIGVLADIIEGKWSTDPTELRGLYKDLIDKYYCYSFNHSKNPPLCRLTTELHKSVLDELEISPNEQISLIVMNDNGKSFKEIAAWIEENL